MSTPLRFVNVTKQFGATRVLADVHFETGPGEFVVLVGPSGCGKSTLMRMVAGLETVTSGEIRAGDRVLNDVPPQDRGVGMVFQSYALYPHMTVRENLAFPLRVRKVSKADQATAVDEVATLLGLGPLLDRTPGQLSGGQRQRVAIGRCLVRQPEIYCFDEPLSNLDAALRTQIRVEIRSLQRRLGKTTLYVTHDQVEAMTLADRIVVLDRGHVQQVGSPKDLYTQPANTFVARFIGSPSMNLVRGRVADGVFRSGDLQVGVAAEAGGLLVGVRTEDVHVGDAAAGEDGATTFRAEIAAVEPVGETGYLHLRVTDADLVASGSARAGGTDADETDPALAGSETTGEGDKQASTGGEAFLLASVPGVDAFRYSVGDTLPVALRADRIHLFDPQTGLRVAAKEPVA